MDSQTPIPTECCKNDRCFKTAAIIFGVLIVIGLFGNIYLLLQKQKSPEQSGMLPTSAPTEILATPTAEAGGCKNDVLKLSVSLPNEKWICKSSIKEGDPEVGRYGLMEISTPVFEIKIGSYMDTGIACYGDEGPDVKCEVVSFFSNSLINLSVLKHNGREISFLGLFKDKLRAIKIDLKQERALTTGEKNELTQFLNSIKEYSPS